MTEQEWKLSGEPEDLLRFLGGKASGRKLRLLACACVRRVDSLSRHPRCCQALETVEGYADGLVGARTLQSARDATRAALRRAYQAQQEGEDRDIELEVEVELLSAVRQTTQAREAVAARYAARHAGSAAVKQAWLETGETPLGSRAWAAGRTALRAMLVEQCDIFRDIFGLIPFYPLLPLASSLSSWCGGLIPTLAQAAYDHRFPSGHLDPARLAVLADAAEEAGCTDTEILLHLRGPGPHVRGCWPVDLLTGRE